jgi:hypothetical protein
VRIFLFLALVLTFVFWFVSLRRAGTLFSIVIRDGRIIRSQGRIPPRLASEIADIIDREGVTVARIRGVLRDGKPVLLFDGEMTPGTEQQMRNVMGQFSAAEVRSGKKR